MVPKFCGHLSARNEVCCAPTRMTPRTPSQLVLLRLRWFCRFASAQVHIVERFFFFHLFFFVGKSGLLHAESDSAIVCVFAVVPDVLIGIHLCGQVGEETNMSGRALWCVSVPTTTMCDEKVRHFTCQIGRCVFAIASVHTRLFVRTCFPGAFDAFTPCRQVVAKKIGRVIAMCARGPSHEDETETDDRHNTDASLLVVALSRSFGVV